MILYDLSFQSPLENLICDDMFLKRAEKDGFKDDVLRLWESPVPFVVLGRAGKVEEDVNTDSCRQDNVEIFHRSSGGGTVVQGSGCLNFSFILSKENDQDLNDLHRSYQKILGQIIGVLKHLGVEAEVYPISDLALSSTKKKFSGNAQRRLRRNILHHGTILYQFDLHLIEKYLKTPKSMPEYRFKRSHLNFVDNINVDSQRIKDAFITYFKPSLIIKKFAQIEHEYLNKMMVQCVAQYLI